MRIVVGYPPGTASDITVRVVGAKLAKLLNGSVVIENRPGNGSNTAAEFVARAQPDGYTILSGSVANAIRVATVSKPTFDLIKDFAPISLVGTVPVMLATHPSLGAKTAPQLIALAKSKPDELFYGSSGVGTAAHLAGELFNVSAGVKLVHVPYAGSSQALADVLTGRIQATFASVSTTMPQVDEGKLVAIGVAERERVALAPNLPTLAEQGMTDFEAHGLVGPDGACRHAPGYRRQARPRHSRGGARSRDDRVAPRAGHHRARQWAGAVPRLHRQRDQEMAGGRRRRGNDEMRMKPRKS